VDKKRTRTRRHEKVVNTTASWYESYHTYEEIIEWLNQQQKNFPDLVTLVNIGTSYEGRAMRALKITSSKARASGAPKVGFWYNSLIHAREWITGATVLYMTNQLLEEYGKDPIITNLLDNMEITVLPVFNVDGYVYTWTRDRMWRKTRSPNSGSSCVGTDPNRNWSFHWGEAGTSTNPCSESFCGSRAFSEVEVRMVSQYLGTIPNLKGYIDFHSYSELWMSPWGYTTSLPKDFTKQNDLSRRCVVAIKAVNGITYDYGPIASTIYPASGSSADYTYGVLDTVYSYGVELRDKGQFGFILPPAQILPSGKETYEALKVFAQTLLT